MAEETWWFWKERLTLPFIEKLGTGAQSYHVNIETYEGLREFLRYEKSLYLFASSEIDTAVCANMLNLNIWTFTYNRPEGQEPVWNVTSPNQDILLYSNYNHRSAIDIALYHADNSHYDLLVRPNSELAIAAISQQH